MPGAMDDLTDLLSMLEDAQRDLERVRKMYEDEPDLLALYEPSASYLVEATRQKVRARLSEIVPVCEADVWIILEGSELNGRNIPIGMVGRFLKAVHCYKHAASILAKWPMKGEGLVKRSPT